jgi:hypothetical protein
MAYTISYEDERVPLSILEGRTLSLCKQSRDTILFETIEGDHLVMGHAQDCCETVSVEEIHGDLIDLVGSPIVIAEEVSNRGETEWGTETWTFYKLATRKGYVTIRWHGSSNGYYSESVDLYRKKLTTV